MFKSFELCVFSLLLFFCVTNAQATESQKIITNTTQYGLTLGASRIIYPLNSQGVGLKVKNPMGYPILVQSRIWDEERKHSAPFVATPPLFRLEGEQQHSLRIIRTGGDYSTDKETLLWACVKGIPPKGDELWAQNEKNKSVINKNVNLNLQVSIDNCIKLLIRPDSVTGTPTDVAEELVWDIDGKNIKVTNPTPFYMNFSSVKLNGKNIEGSYVAPKSSATFKLASGSSNKGRISWSVIDDYGAVSREWSAELK